MGWQKIAIEKLELACQRRDTFNKRSGGIKKKAKELSIMSEAQVLLLLRMPKGQYNLCLGENSFDEVVQKFIHETQENLHKSRMASMQVLNKSYISDSHALNAISLMDHGMRPINRRQGSQEKQLEHIKQEISKIESELGPLRNISEIEKLERYDELTAMENSIIELLATNETHMVHLVEQQRSGCPESLIIPSERGDTRYSTRGAGPNSSNLHQRDELIVDNSSIQFTEREMLDLAEWCSRGQG